MAKKENVIDFPIWNPQFSTTIKFHNNDFKIRYKALRNSSSSFVKRESVKSYILEKYNYKCCYCNSNNDLQIDHIKSVYLVSKGLFDVKKLNTIENLQVLCKTCNASKKPEL